MGLLLRYILITILWLTCATLKSQQINNTFKTKHIGYAEGLSSQRIFSIVEDQHSVIWIATKNGIDRYNGQTVKSYTLQESLYYGDKAGRKLQLIYHQSYGLWGYDHIGRVYRYVPKHDAFLYQFSLDDSIEGEIVLNKMILDSEGVFWIALSKGLYKKEMDGNVVAILPNQYINDIVATPTSIYVASSTGVAELSPLHDINWIIQGEDVQSLYYYPTKKELWVGTFNNGLWIWESSTSTLSPLDSQSESFLNPIRAITSYNEEAMLVGIDGGGVYSIDLTSMQPYLLMSAKDNADIYLRGNGVYAITVDQQKNIWVGSYSGGVSVAIRSSAPIRILKHERGNQHSVSNNNINCIEEGSNNDLWLGTDDGISILTESTNTWKHRLQGVVVVTLCRAYNGNIWVGTYGHGLYLLNQNGEHLKHLTQQKNDLTTNYVFSIKQDLDGDIWVGGHNGWLMQLDKDGGHKQTYNIKWVHSIEILDTNQIGVATVNGFYVINKTTQAFKNYATFSEFQNQNASAYIISMLFNNDQSVWLGTEGGGLSLYDLNSGSTKTYSTLDGLPSDDVYSLQKDLHGRLWMSTGKGLAMMENNKISNLNYLGEVDKEYNKHSFARLLDGRFAFGSTDGAVLVMPNTVTPPSYEAPLRLTKLIIEDLDPKESYNWQPTLYDMLSQEEVTLPYRYNSFSIYFESINHHFQRDINYQHILKGYDKTWSNSSPNGVLSYTNVTPGTYLLKIRTLRHSNGKVIMEKELQLTVLKPWWDSWWAWSIYVLLAGTVSYFIFRYNSNRLQKKHNENKINFFINTAHDIRTPVTLIMAPLEDIDNSTILGNKTKYYLQLARENTRKLHHLITQLLEFEKIDISQQKPTLYPLNINSVIIEKTISFQPYIEAKQLQFTTCIPEEDIYILGERHLLSVLLDNLLSNACKYTLPEGKITITLNATKRKIAIIIQDNGIGIPKKDHKHLFKEVFRSQNAQKTQEIGTGFGLLQVQRIIKMLKGKIKVESEENKGTSFTISLKRHYIQKDVSLVSKFANKNFHLAPFTPFTPQKLKKNYTLKEKSNRDTLLIVEDNKSLRQYLRQTFENDYQVIDASNGQEALSFINTEYPDLILSDVMMPGLQGDDLCHIVKTNPETSSIPFILLTAKTNHDATVAGLKKGADDYIPKPFSSEILKLKVQTLIESRKKLRAYFMQEALKQVDLKNNLPTQRDSLSINKDNMPSLSENDQQFVKRTTQLVLTNLSNNNFTIDQLCREMAMSRTLFYSRLKSLTDMSPQEFIRLIRLENAAKMLQKGKSVIETSEECGFTNSKYFSSLFKQHFGIQPSKYKRTTE